MWPAPADGHDVHGSAGKMLGVVGRYANGAGARTGSHERMQGARLESDLSTSQVVLELCGSVELQPPHMVYKGAYMECSE
jgi:hypothetical protein